MPLSPLQIPGCVIWLDAEDDATFSYSSGALVSQWRDKSPSAYHFAHGNPVVQPFRDTTRNGRKTLRFAGAQVLENAATVPFQNNAATIFAVVVATTHRDYAGFMAARVSAGNDYDQGYGFDLNNGSTAGGQNFLIDRASGGAVIPGAPPCPFAVYSGVMQPSTLPIYKNGVAGTPGGTATGGAIPGLIIGCRWLNAAADYTNYGIQGEWAEFIAYNRILNADERKQIEDALYAKWINPRATQQYLDLGDTVTPWEALTSTGSVVVKPGLLPNDNVAVSDQAALAQDHVLSLSDSVAVSDQAFIGFKPTDISGIAFWLDASILTPGASISSWPSIHNPSWALGLIGSPTPVVTTPQAGQNGLPVMRYTTNGGHVASGVGIDKDFTVVAVARLTGGANQRFIGGYGGNFLVGWHGGDMDIAHLGGWLDGDGGPHPTDYLWKLYTLDGASAGYLPLLYKDGVVIRGTGGGATVGWNNTFSLGGEGSYSGQGSNGEIAEIVAYNRKLSTVERQQVEAYLRQKWITPGAAQTLNLSDTVTPTDGPPDFAQGYAQSFADSVTTTESLGMEVSMVFADGVNVSDSLDAIGAAVFVDVADTVTTSDLLGIAVGEYILPCHPNPIVGTFKAGDAVVGTYWVCARKGILGLGAVVPVLEIHNLAASPAGLGLGATAPFTAMQPPTVIGAGLYLGAYAPGFSLMLTPPLGALGLRGRLPLNVGLEPPIYPAGLILGGHVPKFAGREPPVTPAALGLGGTVPAFKFSHRLPAPSAGLALGGGPPVQVEAILIISSEPHPIDLLPSPENEQVVLLSTGTPVSLDLLSSTAQPVTLGDVDAVPADLNEVECV